MKRDNKLHWEKPEIFDVQSSSTATTQCTSGPDISLLDCSSGNGASVNCVVGNNAQTCGVGNTGSD